MEPLDPPFKPPPPAPPRTFDVPRTHRRRIGALCGSFVLVAAALESVALSARVVEPPTRVVCGGFGAIVFVVAWLLAWNACRSVTIADDGLRSSRRFDSRVVRWDGMAAIEFEFAPKHPSRRGDVGGFLGWVVGAVLGGLGAASVGRSVGQSLAGGEGAAVAGPRGDPLSDAASRGDVDPSACVYGDNGAVLAYFSDELGWDFFTTLRDEARVRGIAVDRIPNSATSD